MNTKSNVPFSGSPKLYLKWCIIGSIVFHSYVLFGYWFIKNVIVGVPWPESYWPIIATILWTAFFARMAYRWIMRLDAQYGRGKGWEMESITVKLPYEKARKT